MKYATGIAPTPADVCSRRDQLAIAALPAVIAQSSSTQIFAFGGISADNRTVYELFARTAFGIADAMIAESQKGGCA